MRSGEITDRQRARVAAKSDAGPGSKRTPLPASVTRYEYPGNNLGSPAAAMR